MRWCHPVPCHPPSASQHGCRSVDGRAVHTREEDSRSFHEDDEQLVQASSKYPLILCSLMSLPPTDRVRLHLILNS